jgi:hypothetical protein
MWPAVKLITASIGLAFVAGCNAPTFAPPEITPETLAFSNVVAESDRMVADSFRDIAFTEGRVAVVAVEDGRMRTYWLVPCRNGEAICAGGPNGRAVSLTSNPDFRIVSGAYRGRDFYLSPGGDGMMITRDGRHQLAWE